MISTARPTAREIALEVLLAVERGGAYANQALHKALEKYRPGKLDRAFATELTYGTLRTLNTLDWYLGHFIPHSVKAQAPEVRNVLRLGAYQILFMDRVPDFAAVHEAVEMARRYGHPGSAKFVNGVLRNLVRKKDEIVFPALEEDAVGHISLRYSHPAWLVRLWINQFGVEETIELCLANNRPAPNTVRTNTLKITRAELIQKLREAGVDAVETALAPEGLHIEGFYAIGELQAYRQGLFQVQDESSMLAAHALSPEENSLVIDMAAAPGGKTTHLAQLMRNTGEIIAFDLYPHKLKLIEDNCRRLGVKNVHPRLGDARRPPVELEEKADYVLLDAPCSGLGVLRRRPDLRWVKSEDDIGRLVELQADMLAGAARCVRPGGVLVYSTCTLTLEENQHQIETFLRSHPQFYLESMTGLLPPAVDSDGTLAQGYVQLLPHRHGTDGFFLSRMRRKRN